jgi:hypothetical protein
MSTYVSRVALWLSTADEDTLNRCPSLDRNKHAILGATVLVPTLFGCIAAAYAAATLTDNGFIIAATALLWSFFILTIDRALLVSFRHNLHPAQKVFQFTVRFSLAVLLGMTISHPLVLLLFEQRIDAALVAEHRQHIEKTRSDHATTTALIDADIAKTKALLDDAQGKLQVIIASPSTSLPLGNDREPDQLDAQLKDLGDQLKRIREEIAHWSTEYDREVTGNRSGIAGEGPRAKHIRESQLSWRHEEVTRISGQITALSEERKKRDELVAQDVSLRGELEAAKAKRTLQSSELLLTSAEASVAALRADLDRLHEQKHSHLGRTTRELDRLNSEPAPRDLLSRTLALHRLFEDEKEGGAVAHLCYIILTLVFIALDTIPLVTKFTIRPGHYDVLIDALESASHRDPCTTANQKLPPASLPNLSTMHPVQAARMLRELLDVSPDLSSQRDIAEAVNRTQQEISTFFAILRVPEDFQEALLSIPDLSLYTAALVCRRGDPEHRATLLNLLRDGASQSRIKAAIRKLEQQPQAF